MSKYFRTISTTLKSRATHLRQNMTDEERILWAKLQHKSLHYKFRRQYVVENYIVDFVCLEKKLVIELDGSQHFEERQKQYDEKRTLLLEQKGFRVLRFSNWEVKSELKRVLDVICLALDGEM